MTIGIFFDPSLFFILLVPAEGAAPEVDFCAAPTPPPVGTESVPSMTTDVPTTVDLREGGASLDIFVPVTATPREAVAGVEAPIARADDDVASCKAFSLINRCLSSSLARIGTRSSGMGLFS